MWLTDFLIADWCVFEDQAFFLIVCVIGYGINPARRALPSDARIVAVIMREQSRSYVAFADINPRIGFEKPVAAELIGVEGFDVRLGKCPRRLLREWHIMSHK